jgi:hypothetical protein
MSPQTEVGAHWAHPRPAPDETVVYDSVETLNNLDAMAPSGAKEKAAPNTRYKGAAQVFHGNRTTNDANPTLLCPGTTFERRDWSSGRLANRAGPRPHGIEEFGGRSNPFASKLSSSRCATDSSA